MDLVLWMTGGPHRELALRSCLRSLLPHVEYETLYLLGVSPSIPLTHVTRVVHTGTEFRALCLLSEEESLSEQFLYMDDHTILRGPWDRRLLANSGFLPRVPSRRQRMVNTLGVLLTRDLPTYDYEINAPVVMVKGNLRTLRAEVEDVDYAVRTLYFNRFFATPMGRMESTEIEKWSHADDPGGEVLHLSDTALDHRRCQQWLLRNFPKKSWHEL